MAMEDTSQTAKFQETLCRLTIFDEVGLLGLVFGRPRTGQWP